MEQTINRKDRMLQASDKRRLASMRGVIKKKGSRWQMHHASKGRVIQDTLSVGTHMLCPRPIEDQRGTGLMRRKKRNPLSASRPSPWDHDKRASPGDESIWRGNVHAANTHVAKLHITLEQMPQEEPWWGDIDFSITSQKGTPRSNGITYSLNCSSTRFG